LSGIFTVFGFLSLYPILFLSIDKSSFLGKELFKVFGAWAPVVAILIAGINCYFFFYLGRQLKEIINVFRATRMRKNGESDCRSPFLFLRPFSEGPLTSQPARAYGRQAVEIYGHAYAQDIAESFSGFGQVIAIGGPLDIRNFYEDSTVMYIQSNEKRWREMFILAATASRAVIMIPGTSNGILHEAGVIRDLNLWSRVICFMPPSPDPGRSFKFLERIVDESAAAKEWRRVRLEWGALGYKLPPYDPKGKLFTCTNGFQVKKSVTLDFDVSKSSTAIELLLPIPPVDSKPLSSVLPDLLLHEAPRCRPHLFNRFFDPG
jgi:hypothetical protein